MHRICTLTAVATLAAAASAQTTTAPAAGPAVAERPADPVITVLEAGDSPRQALRLSLPPGAEQQFELRSARRALDDAVAASAPAMSWSFSTVVREQDEAGDVHFDFRCTRVLVEDDPAIPPHVLQAMRQAILAITGIGGRGVLSDRAVLREAAVNVPDGLDPGLRPFVLGMEEMFHQLTSPLPDVPVGVGARWRVVRKLRVQGLTVDQTATYTLTESDGTAFRLQVQVEQQARDQAIEVAGGATMTIKSLVTRGDGTLHRRLDDAFPVNGRFRFVTDSTSVIEAGDRSLDVSQRIEQTTEVRER